MRVGYIRVSTLDQSVQRQLEGVTLDKTFVDKCSGKDVNRPAYAEMISYVREGDTLIVHSLDRLSRSLRDLTACVDALTAKGVRVEFVKENLVFSSDENNPMSKLLFHLLGAFAEFERSLIRERQKEGIELAKRAGKYAGRSPSLKPEDATEAKQRALAGIPVARIARDMKVSRNTVYKALKS